MDDGAGAFAEFQRLVTHDPQLAARLRPILDMEAFVAAVVVEGGARGLRFEANDVAAVLQANQHGWLTSWLPVL